MPVRANARWPWWTSRCEECPREEAFRYARLLRDKAMYLGNVGKPGSIPLLP